MKVSDILKVKGNTLYTIAPDSELRVSGWSMVIRATPSRTAYRTTRVGEDSMPAH